jgi:hypothetical protein
MKKKYILAAFVLGLSVSAKVMAQVPSNVPTNGLIGYWPFNGNANDIGGNGNNGAPQNGIALSIDRFGNPNSAYLFDGVDDYIQINDNQSLNPSLMTISAWINISDTNQTVLPIFYKGEYEVYSLEAFKFAIKQNSNCLSYSGGGWVGNSFPNFNYDQNNWYNLVGVFDGSNVKFYINGILVSATPTSVATIDNCSQAGEGFHIGRYHIYDPNYFKGKIDDIGIWNRALTQQEITAIYDNYVGCSTANIIYQTINSTDCNSYTSTSGQQYNQSGTYNEIISNYLGCDSVLITLNLIINGNENVSAPYVVQAPYCPATADGSITVNFTGPSTPYFFISEYYFGSGSDKVLELYNPKNSPFYMNAFEQVFLYNELTLQYFVIPSSLIIPAHGTILISSVGSSISSDLTSDLIDGSALSLYVMNGFGWIIDKVNPISNESITRKYFVTGGGDYFYPYQWNTVSLGQNTLGNHEIEYYETHWSNGFIGDTLSNLVPGSYSYDVVQMLSGCTVISENQIVVSATYSYNPTFSSAQQLYTSPPFAVQFNNTSVNISNYSFTWDFGDGTTLASNNASVFHQYSFNGQYTVSLIATSNVTGCSDTTTLSDYIFCTGGVSCTHAASISQTSPLQACQDAPVWLTCNNDPSFTYEWRKNGVTISGNNNDSLAVTQSGTYSVTILVNNCPVNSNDVVVNILSAPTTPIISSNGVIQSCIGGSVTLNAGSYATYNWSTGATTQSINVSNSGSYSVSVTGANGCSAASAPFNVNASFVAPPQVCIVGMDSLTNENRIVWEKPLTSGIDSFYVYKESIVSNVYTKIGATDFNDLAVFLDANSNPAVQAYRYKISALDTCGTESNVGDFHKTIHLTINQGVGNSWNLIWSHYEGLTFGSYKIYRGTSLSNMALLTTIQSNLNSYTDLTPPTGPVYYQIEVVNPNNCDPTKVLNYSVSRSNIVNNGINAISEEILSTINVYPNPTNDKFTINVSNDLLGKNYQIADFAGRVIAQGKINSLIQIVDIQGVSNGSYLLQIDQPTVQAIKIVKQ